MAGELPRYRGWLIKQRCCVPDCIWPTEVHHHTGGDTVAPGEQRSAKSTGTRRGKGQVAHDYYGMPLCHGHHMELHALKGWFRDFVKSTLREWQDRQVAEHRARYTQTDVPNTSGIPATQQWKEGSNGESF